MKGLEKNEVFEDICYISVLKVLIKLGVEKYLKSGIDNFRKEMDILEKYDRFFKEIMRSLVLNEYLAINGQELYIPQNIKDKIASFNLKGALDEVVKNDPQYIAHSKLLIPCIESYEAILKGEIKSTDVIFPDGKMDLVSGIYKGNKRVDYYNKILCQIVKAAIEQSIGSLPEGERLTILEVGAGTGGTSAVLFDALKDYKQYIRYIYTDISKSFLFYAEEKYKNIAPYLETQLFNIESAPDSQGIIHGSADIVIGVNVVHATKNIATSIQNIKAVLKKRGLIVLNEIAQTEIFTTTTFGLLDGWWLYEDEELRLEGSPGLSSDSWREVLLRTGYENITIYPEDSNKALQIIVAESNGEVMLVQDNHQLKENRVAREDKVSVNDTHQNLESIASVDPKKVESLIRSKLALVLKMEPSDFDYYTSMSDYGVDSILGLNLVKEINKHLTISVPTTALFDYPTIKDFSAYLLKEHSRDFVDQERKITDKKLKPPYFKSKPERKFQENSIDKKEEDVNKLERGSCTGVVARRNKGWKLWLEAPDTIDNIKVLNFKPEMPGSEEVLVTITNFSLNFGDLLCVKGMYPTMPLYPFSPGFEASGIVQNIGKGVTKFKVGDKVIVLADRKYGLHCSHFVAKERQLIPVPKNQTLCDACAIPVVSMTMVEVFRRINAKKGDSILIQTATGGIGLVTIQLAKYYGLKIIATAGSQTKLNYLRSIGISSVINYRTQDFEKEVKKITNGEGVSIVVNTLSGENIQKGINCLDKRGQYVELSMTAIKSARQIDLSNFSNNQSFIAIDLRKLMDEDLNYFESLWNESKELIESGILQSKISKEIPFEDYKKAYKILEDRGNIGKVVVKVIHEDLESTSIFDPPSVSTNLEEMNIAIVGMSGQYGKADDLYSFWKKLREGESLIEEVPENRWSVKEHYSPDKTKEDKTYCKWGSFLQDIDKFDPLFFRISGREAENMDPQQRLFLQHCWSALEDAGIPSGKMDGMKCGVYAGAGHGDYLGYGNSKEASSFWSNTISILASRISYYLNLKGPAVAIDTACSSSLVALHMACKSLQQKDTDIVLSGGVSIITTPMFFKLASKAGMLSEDGRCYTFDHRANGFVPGEGVGVVVLKRLEDAQRNGDHIYGVIKGSGINQDGRTNGITAPSIISQEELEKEVYDKYSINPETISYVEAHGTGTSLGDPIEFEALTKSFKNKTDKVGFCSLGSVKTNIGHTLMAAGIAGIQKVLLSMKHKELPASLNFDKANSLISLDNSPFYINNKFRSWTVENNQPRRAAISSFGFSGTNAHVIIEEYVPEPSYYQCDDPAIVLLSARDKERLKEQVANLIEYLKENRAINLYDVAYTLQVGRDAMEERLALVVNSAEELKDQLDKYIKGSLPEQLTGNVTTENSGFLLDGEAGKGYIEIALKNKEIKSLAQLWVKGITIDWDLLYSKNNHPKRVSLPTYPFARERYWISEPESSNLSGTVSKLHPLLHKNNSNLSEQKFKSVFTGEESFLSDHRINKQKILPGVAYLEMAREAGMQSIEGSITQISNVVWLSPIHVNGRPQEVQLSVFEEGNTIGYEIFSKTENIYSQGKLSSLVLTAPAPFDIELLKSNMESQRSGVHCYELFKNLGIELGASFRGIEQMYYGNAGALSKINLPKEEGFVLQPGLLDSALQSSVGLYFSKGESGVLRLPFSVKEVNLYGDVHETNWCYVRRSPCNNLEKEVSNLDIDMLSASGEVLLSFKDFVTLPLNGVESKEEEHFVSEGNCEEASLYLYSTFWEESVIKTQEDILTSQSLIVLAGGSVALAEKLTKSLTEEVLAINDDITELEYHTKVLALIQSITEPTELIIIYSNDSYIDYGFISGLLKTAALENPKVNGKTIGVESLTIKDVATLAEIINSEKSTVDKEILYDEGKRKVRIINQLAQRTDNELCIKEEGVYLITGGAGGLGQIFANHISKTENTTLILTGRSKNSTLSQKELQSINAVYHSCDLTDKAAVSVLIEEIIDIYGKLDGIIHSAGIIRDSFLINKTIEESKEVLAPKILGAKYLDQSTRNLDLDFMVYFSSLASIFGNAGQGDYSSANAWLDNYAVYRNEQVSEGSRRGHTISINWPLWEEGAMKMDSDKERYMKQKWRIRSLPTEQGILAFEKLLSAGSSQGIVVFGQNHSLIKQPTPSSKLSSDMTPQITSVSPALEKEVRNTVSGLISGLLKMDIERISFDKDLGDYGFDSILLTKLSNELNNCYDLQLLPILFYSYPTIDSLVGHLIADYPEQLSKCHTTTLEVTSKPIIELDNKEISLNRKRKRFKTSMSHRMLNDNTVENAQKDVAIIGISGRFPGSPNLNIFWDNLKNNKDLITEVPEDRWDWKSYYGYPTEGQSKTKAKWGGFIKDMDKFDPLFFNISPREAELMDPQQRITLEAVFQALEDAGISSNSIKGSNTGVFMGVSSSDYYSLLRDQEDLVGHAKLVIGSTHSILVNRISYLLDIHGPSEPIDTACSSSLIAVHRAVEHIRNGHCDMAISGGVNAILSPDNTLSFSQAGMLSEDGRCKTFDQGANGYVRGEGVGVAILKSLRKAESDGDHIYAVIRGTAENHGGKANTLSSPNPMAQKELLLKAYRVANLDPRNVSYIEAHGTGTSLGDPIEAEGLKMAFRELYQERNSDESKGTQIKLGSVKTNIGHLESAAGIAGVLKVVQSIKHKTIPGNPNLKTPNEYLQLENSPFILQKETTSWDIEEGKPRIAGVSSFGFGGVNAHVIIEEYISEVKEAYRSNDAAIIVLSAKNEDRLKAQVINLIDYLQANEAINLYDVAYTLQLGRESMEERLAFVVNDLEDLRVQLNQYVKGDFSGLLIGNVINDKSDFILQGKAGKSYIDTAIREKELNSLAQLWVKGVVIHWSLLYDKDNRPGRISLPTYPFARERYWIPESKSQDISGLGSKLHPLLHINNSNLSEQKFKSVFTGKESFLSDHRINDKKILPGVAYLEMAREAGALSIEGSITQIKNVVWLHPIYGNDRPEEVRLSIFEEDNTIKYEIYGGVSGEENLCSKGCLSIEELATPYFVDLELIRLGMKGQKSGKHCYELFKDLGLNLGQSFQGIEMIYYDRSAALSKINLPKDTAYVLQPGLLDSALQTSMGIGFLERKNETLNLPFSVEEVNIYGDVSTVSWCHSRLSTNSKPESEIFIFDIDMLSDSGEVVLSFRDLVAIPLDTINKKEEKSIVQISGLIEPSIQLFSNDWHEKNPKKTNDWSQTESNQLILLAGSSSSLSEKLAEELEQDIIAINEETELDYYNKVQELVQSCVKDNSKNGIVLIYRNNDYINHSFIHGLLKTTTIEYSKLECKIIGVESLSIKEIKSLSAIIRAEQFDDSKEVRYIDKKREVRIITPLLEPEPLKESLSIKEGGVYLITGGEGALGQLFAKYISKTKDSTLILTGRSPESKLTSSELKNLRAIYCSCDVTNKTSVEELIEEIIRSYGRLNGILHSAGIVKDSFLVKKTVQESKTVLSPKILGAKNLDLATNNVGLDFVIYFSSLSGVIGNIGQADYSSANAWLDNYARYRNKLVREGKRRGHTMSINWPLWEDGGMKMNSKTQAYFQQEMGVYRLPSDRGLDVFKRFLTSKLENGIVLYGDDRLSRFINKFNNKSKEKRSRSAKERDVSYESLALIVKDQIHKIFKIPVEQLVDNKDLADFGGDSILFTSLVTNLNKVLGISLTATALFEYRTVEELVQYILKDHKPDLKNEVVSYDSFARKDRNYRKLSSNNRIPDTDYAIIAASGRFSSINTEDDLWKKVEQGRCLEVTSNHNSDTISYGKLSQKNYENGFPELNISSSDVLKMSLQEQLIFEVIATAMTNYGLTLEDLSSKPTGVFISAQQVFKDNSNKEKNLPLAYLIPNKVSFYLNLNGPSEVVNTYCTSVYVAIHRAIQSIVSGECEQAIIGGVNVISEEEMVTVSDTEFGYLLSQNGQTKSFCEDAQGFVRSEGVGILIIKPLAFAKKSNNRILAVIKGSSAYHGGKGFSVEAPSAKGIKKAIELSLLKSRIGVDTIDYIEAHGIANLMADAIELGAINSIYKKHSKNSNKKWNISSIKPTLGHSELASGMASLLKVLKALEHKTIPGIPGLENINSEIPVNHTLILSSNSTPWENGRYPRRAALNSYAVGGVNAHIIIEEYTNNKYPLSKLEPEKSQSILQIKPEEPLVDATDILDKDIFDSEATSSKNYDSESSFLDRISKEQRNKVEELFEGILRIPLDQIKKHDSIFNYDFSSIQLMKFVRSVNEVFGIHVKMSEILSLNNFKSIFHLFESAIVDEKSPLAVPVDKNDDFTKFSPLSEGQKGLWFIQVSEPMSTTYNVPIALCINEKIDSKVIDNVVDKIREKYPILCSVFKRDDITGLPYQEILDSKRLEKDIQVIQENHDIVQIFRTLLRQPMDISKGVMRFHIREDIYQNKTYLLFIIHHIVFDGISVFLLINEFVKLYEDFVSGNKNIEVIPDQSYYDFVNWESTYIKSNEGKESLIYWKEKLQGRISKLELPYDYTQKIGFNSYDTDGVSGIKLQGKELEILRSTARNLKTGLSILMLSVFKVLLSKITSVDDIIVAIPTAVRYSEKYEKSLGYYINIMLSRTKLLGEEKFSDLLNKLNSEFNSSIDYVQYPYPKLLSTLGLTKGKDTNLFPVAFNYKNFANVLQVENSVISDKIQHIDNIHQEITNEYTLDILDTKNEFSLQLRYRKDLFLEKTIKRHLGYYRKILNEVISNSQICIDDIQVIPEQEQQLLVEFNNSNVDYPKTKCVHGLFEAQAKKTPNNVAVVFEQTKITYATLEKQSKQLAIYLQKQGIKPDTLVGICMERSIEMIVSILAVLRAGGAYIPIDPNYPEERIAYMLQDGVVKGNERNKVKIVLTQDYLVKVIEDTLKDLDVQMISLAPNWEDNKTLTEVKDRLQRKVSSDNLAYVIYTSGSTGKPKGVMVEHDAILNRIQWMQEKYGLGENDRVLQKTPFSFDVSVWELLWSISYGAQLVFALPGKHIDPNYIRDIIGKRNITFLHFVPSMLRAFLSVNRLKEQCSSLHTVICSGEALGVDVKNLFFDIFKNTGLHNLYGPTEAAIDVTYWPCEKESELVPIGKPISNIQIYIVNKKHQLVPMGVAGELCIAGIGLARGYLNNQELTEKKFVNNPFGEDRIYKTGDVARWLPDGTIEYLGRMDHQVKIRGFRIELGEIEVLLNAHKNVQNSAVIIKENSGGKYLVAYYVSDGNGIELEDQVLRKYLFEHLPEYMVPAFFVAIDKIPISHNGKLDKKKLTSLDLPIKGTAKHVHPATKIQQQLIKIWKELLEIEQVDIHDNFFDIGGNSLLGITMQQRIQRDLGREISIMEILQYSTIKNIANHIEGTPKNDEVLLKRKERFNKRRRILSGEN